MAYEGDVHVRHTVQPRHFLRAFAVVVSGAALNPCGHILLNTGGRGGWYFHIAQVRGFPHCMGEEGYRRYLRENKKREIRRTWVPVKEPHECLHKLEELLRKKWTWFLLPNNCASFVEDVLQAGGTKAGLYSNCPTKEIFR